MLTSLMENCSKCPLNGRSHLAGVGNDVDPKIVIVLDSPPRQEEGSPPSYLSGNADVFFRKIIQRFTDGYDIYITFACQCHPPSNRNPSPIELGYCKNNLYTLIRELNPQIVIGMGKVVASQLYPEFTKITYDRGHIITLPTGHPAILTFSPDAIVMNDGHPLFGWFHADIQKAFNFINKVVNPYEHPKDTSVFVCNTDDDVDDTIAYLETKSIIAYDWETTGLNPRIARGYCLGMSAEQGRAVVIPIDTVLKHLTKFQALFNNPDITFVAFNAVFDAQFNNQIGINPRIDGDPMLMHYMLDERRQARNLETLSMQFCEAPPYESMMLKEYDVDKSSFLKVIPPEVIYTYCGKDCDYTLRLFNCFNEKLLELPTILNAYQSIVIPAAQMIQEVQPIGLYVDQPLLYKLIDEYTTNQADALNSLVELSESADFNPNSPQQVAKIMWDEFGLSEPELFGRKDRSVDAETRKALLKTYPNEPFVEALMDYKFYNVMLTRYLIPILEYIEEDGRVRTNWHLDRTETGRLSTSKPPLHQIPRESDIRGIFSAPEGRTLVQADYAQIEMRMAAHIAQDTEFTKIFKSGIDFHTKMASEAYRIPPESVTPEQRQAAKGVSFGLLYLMGVKKLADNTGLPPDEAFQFVANYKALMPKVMEWIEGIKEQIRKEQRVFSIFGRCRRFPLLTKENLNGLFRQGVNMPIQSSASDLTLSSTIEVHKVLKERYPSAHILLTVHDSILVECNEEDANDIAQMMDFIMETPLFETKVPFNVEIKIGKQWGKGTIWKEES